MVGLKDTCVHVYVVSEATRNSFRDHKFQKFSWESTPEPPYTCMCTYCCTTLFSHYLVHALISPQEENMRLLTRCA